jgi:hypothetical protein
VSVLVPSLAEAILEYHRVERARKEAAAAASGIHDVPVLPRALQLIDHIVGTCRQSVRTAKTLEDPSISDAGAVPDAALAAARELAIATAQRASAAAVDACELIREPARNTSRRPVGEITRDAMRNLDAAIGETLKRSNEGRDG